MKPTLYVLFGFSLCLTLTAPMAAADVSQHKQTCSSAQMKIVDTALTDAKSALLKAIKSIKTPSAEDLDRQQRWFGALNSSTGVRVQQVYEKSLALANFSQYWCPQVNDLDFKWQIGDLAAIDPDTQGAIFLTPAFFKLDVTGVDSLRGTLIHELTHLAGIGLKPEFYGVTDTLALAKNDTLKAQNNSDNFQYYVEDLIFKLP